jgi:DNA-binding CsgD family transcriptional regulator/tetratricopeptide (TPR) repeat protein
LFHNLVVAGRPREAAELAEEAESAARSTGDANAKFAFVLANAGLAYSRDEFERTLTQIETSIPLGRAANDEARERLAEQWHSNSLEILDRFDDALRVGAGGRAAAQRSGRAWALRQYDKWRARQLFQAGRLSDAAAVLEGLFVIEEREQVLNTIDAAALLTLGRIAVHTGDTRQTATCEAKARAMLETSVPEVRRQASWLLALVAMARKQPLAGRERLAAVGEDASRTSILPIFPMDVTDPAQLARIAVEASDEDLAGAAVTIAEHRASLNPEVASIAGTAAQAVGLVHRDEQQLTNAVEILGRSPRPLAHASALEDLGRILLQREKRANGIERLEQALERYASVGATWDAARVRGRLRSVGVRRRLVTPSRPDSGWSGLTEAELAVVRIVAQGVTNREVADRLFVSPHTVSTHLRHAFAKLGVHSRVELARLASDRDFRPDPPA